MSPVYSARCSATGRPVILKEYDGARMRARHGARVRREEAALRALAGEGGVVQLYGAFPAARGGGTVLVLEHCTRGDLFKAERGLGGRGWRVDVGCDSSVGSGRGGPHPALTVSPTTP